MYSHQLVLVSTTVRKSSKLIEITPFCCVSRTRNASVKRCTLTQRTMNSSTVISLWSLLLAVSCFVKFGEKLKPICEKAVRERNKMILKSASLGIIVKCVHIPWFNSWSSTWPDPFRSYVLKMFNHWLIYSNSLPNEWMSTVPLLSRSNIAEMFNTLFNK